MAAAAAAAPQEHCSSIEEEDTLSPSESEADVEKCVSDAEYELNHQPYCFQPYSSAILHSEDGDVFGGKRH